MSDDPVVIEFLDVVRVADEVTAEFPDRKNPYTLDSDGRQACLYTDLEDPTLHCLGGEILLRLRCELPDERESVLTTSDKLRFAGYINEYQVGPALKFLAHLQSGADGGQVHEVGSEDLDEDPDDYRMEWRLAFERSSAYYRDVIDAAERLRDESPR